MNQEPIQENFALQFADAPALNAIQIICEDEATTLPSVAEVGAKELQKDIQEIVPQSADAGVLPVAFSQDEIAFEFSRRYGRIFRFVGAWDKWLMFNGTHWELEKTVRVYDLCRKLCREFAAG